MNKTSIEYLTDTWSPIAMRCTPCSPGCENCWHIKRADMLGKNPKIDLLCRAAYRGEIGPQLIHSRLGDPIKRKKAARIGVQFMGDLFHPDIPWESKIGVLSVAHKAPQHTFVLLTKRIKNALEFCIESGLMPSGLPSPACNTPSGVEWPKNAWLGVTVCNQEELWKIDELRKIPAAVRFVSFEPLLSKITNVNFDGIHQIIIGCESGPKRRKSEIIWIENLIRQSAFLNIAIFVKQAEINGKLVKIPKILGRTWEEYPRGE